MAVLRFREATEGTGTGKPTVRRAINSDRMSAELTEDGAPRMPRYASSRHRSTI